MSVLDRSAQDLLHLLVLALSLGLLVLLERRASPYGEPERGWTLAETLYATRAARTSQNRTKAKFAYSFLSEGGEQEARERLGAKEPRPGRL